MKTSILGCVLLHWFALAVSANNVTNSFVGVWKVDWNKPPVITSIPAYYASISSFKTVEEYRDYVTRRAKGLVLDIKAKDTAVMRYADGKSETYRWELSPEDPKYDIWMQWRPHFMAASIGHGFKVSETNANMAILTFQLEWNEDVATRVPLVMERQKPEPGKAK